MLTIKKKLRLLITGLLCSLVAGLMVTAFFQFLSKTWDLARALDLYFYNIFFVPTLKPPANLFIIDTNDPDESRSRGEYADIIHQLRQAGARCIAFDILFLKPHVEDPDGDRKLAQSVAGGPEVILAMTFDRDQPPPAWKKAELKRLALPDSLGAKFTPKIIAPREAQLPFDSLFFVTPHLGHINSVGGESHRFPLAMAYNEKLYAALPFEMARIYFAADSGLHHLTDLPIDKDGQLLVNFIPLDKIKRRLYAWKDMTELLQKPQANIFHNAVVLIVNPMADSDISTVSGTHEPTLETYPGWALLASVASQLLLNRHIEARVVSDPAFYSMFMVLLGMLWLLLVAPRLDKKWRKTRVIFVAGSGLFLLLIFLLLNLGRQWIGVVVPLLAFNVSMLMARKVYYVWTKPPQYVKLGLAVSERQGNKYPVQVFESEVGVDTSDISFDSFLEEEKFQDTIDRIKDWEASREDIRWIGDKFFNALFPSQIYYLLQNSLDKAQRENKYVRLRLRLDASELVCLPWELMHSSNLDSEYIALHRRLSLVRFLPLGRLHVNSQSRRPLTILVFISRSRMDDLGFLKEKKNIKKALRPLIWSLDVRIRICEQATMENLSRELEGHPDILHYIGHAGFDDRQNEAYLEFDGGHKVFARTLKSLLAESSIKLAVLNSCETAAAAETDAFTGVAQNLVKVGIPAVVAMQLRIPDDTATWFSEIFYSKLLQFHSIAVAVAETRRKTMERTELDQQHWATPVLFMREGEPVLFDPN